MEKYSDLQNKGNEDFELYRYLSIMQTRRH